MRSFSRESPMQTRAAKRAKANRAAEEAARHDALHQPASLECLTEETPEIPVDAFADWLCRVVIGVCAGIPLRKLTACKDGSLEARVTAQHTEHELCALLHNLLATDEAPRSVALITMLLLDRISASQHGFAVNINTVCKLFAICFLIAKKYLDEIPVQVTTCALVILFSTAPLFAADVQLASPTARILPHLSLWFVSNSILFICRNQQINTLLSHSWNTSFLYSDLFEDAAEIKQIEWATLGAIDWRVQVTQEQIQEYDRMLLKPERTAMTDEPLSFEMRDGMLLKPVLNAMRDEAPPFNKRPSRSRRSSSIT